MALDVLLVSLLYVVIDPLLKPGAQPGVDNVGDPLPWQQMELLFIKQVTHQRGILPGLLEHAFNANVLILGAVDLSMLVRLDAYSC